MKSEIQLFAVVGAFFAVVAVGYGIVTDWVEPVGWVVEDRVRVAQRPHRCPALRLPDDVVLLPDEPYVFTASDGPEAFASVPTHLVSGRLITWYGPAMLEAATLWMNRPGSQAGRPY